MCSICSVHGCDSCDPNNENVCLVASDPNTEIIVAYEEGHEGSPEHAYTVINCVSGILNSEGVCTECSVVGCHQCV